MYDPMNNPDLRIPVTMTIEQQEELRDRIEEELALGADASTLIVTIREFLAGEEILNPGSRETMEPDDGARHSYEGTETEDWL